MDMAGRTAPPFPLARQALEVLSPHELSPLVKSSTREQILFLARNFPLSVQTACYECRLSEADSRVDLALCVFPGVPKAILAQLRREYGRDPCWSRTLEFLEHWEGAASHVPFVWVAFDLDQSLRTLPSPCLGLCADAKFFERRLGLEHGPGATPEELLERASSYFEQLCGSPLPESSRARIVRCLGPNVEAKHFSYMLGRTPATFKLDVRLPIEHVGAYLEQIGWPGPSTRIAARIREFMPWSGHIQLNLVLHPELRGPLEVEFMTLAPEVSLESRTGFMTRLVQEGLCDVEKAEVLLRAWSNPRRKTDDGRKYAQSWYVKVRFEDDRAVEAKTYLGVLAHVFAT